MWADLRYLAGSIVFIVVATLGYFGIERMFEDPQSLDPIPQFHLPWLSQTATAAPKEFERNGLRGRPAVINFWASWCERCSEEKPLLQELAQQPGMAAVMVGVATQDEKPRVEAAETAKPHGYPIALDVDGLLARRFGVPGLPNTIVLDADGQVLERFERPLTRSDLIAIQEMVGKGRAR